MIQFYAKDLELNPILPEGESSHCCRVLRMKEGDIINVTDGKGNRFICEIIKANPLKTEVSIKEKLDVKQERSYKITLAVAPTKNSDRMEWMVEKAVEIGVDKIVLLCCQRSERRVQKTERLQKVMISAMKQSLSSMLPELIELTSLQKFVTSTDPFSQKFFGYCSTEFPRKEFVKELKPGGETIVMIGPEGDFTDEEVKLSVENGFLPVSFGNKRLRTETAGVFAISAVNVINQLKG